MINIAELERQIFEINEEDTWDELDYICLKRNANDAVANIYVLEGHPSYRKNLSQIDKETIQKMRDLQCYSNSELSIRIGEKDNQDKFYVRINVNSKLQEIEIINYFMEDYQLTDNQIKIINGLEKLESVIKLEGDYKPLYFCGYLKSKKEESESCLRLYYKTYGMNEVTDYSKQILRYFSTITELEKDPMYTVVNDLVEKKIVRLWCVGVELDKKSRIRIKYFLIPLGIEEEKKKTFQMLEQQLLGKSNDEISYIFMNCEDLICDIIQVSSGFDEETMSVSIYMKHKEAPKHRYYSLRSGIVLRDIGGYYFLVDIKDKYCYTLKSLFTLNEMGKVIVEYLDKHGVCTIVGIVSYVISLLKNYDESMYDSIYYDCLTFIEQLLEKRYVVEEQ